MCNIAAAVGVGLLLMLSSRGGSKDEYKPPVAPRPSTNYGSRADAMARNNENLPNDGAGSPTTSSQIIAGQQRSKSGGGYRTQLAIPKAPQATTSLPTIGSYTPQKPVNY